MEQDIEILERMLKIEKECLHYDVSQDEIRAIEHLIKAYKELEEFKKQVTEIENTNFIKYKNYIPVSLVEEKIEELKEKRDDYLYKLQVYGDFRINEPNYSDLILQINFKIQVLQELLEKR